MQTKTKTENENNAPIASAQKVKFLIVGAGPTGLGAAWRLCERNEHDFLLVDKASEAGGLSSSFKDDKGFTWDLGGHVIFSHYEYFTALLNHIIGPSGFNEIQRSAWARFQNQWIPYPFQNNIWRLNESDLKSCLDGLEELKTNVNPVLAVSNFQEWIYASFGKGLAELFMIPYNKKVWACSPTEMNTKWVSERVATLNVDAIRTLVEKKQDSCSWGPNSCFRFPKHGGTGAIWKGLYNKLPDKNKQLNFTLECIDKQKKICTFIDCKTGLRKNIEYEHLITTIPLDQCCAIVNIPIALSDKLVYSSTHIVGLGIQGQVPDDLKDKSWMYFSEASSPFYRVTVFSNYSQSHVPTTKSDSMQVVTPSIVKPAIALPSAKPAPSSSTSSPTAKPSVASQSYWSLMCETSERAPYKPVNEKTIIDETIQGLINNGLLKSTDIIVSKVHKRLEYGYPTPFLKRDEIIDPLLIRLQKENIYSRGRFGAWKYEVSNQDHSLMQGVEVVDSIIEKNPKLEKTLWTPNIVNAPGQISKEPPFVGF